MANEVAPINDSHHTHTHAHSTTNLLLGLLVFGGTTDTGNRKFLLSTPSSIGLSAPGERWEGSGFISRLIFFSCRITTDKSSSLLFHFKAAGENHSRMEFVLMSSSFF
jgi:hypothetical protein